MLTIGPLFVWLSHIDETWPSKRASFKGRYIKISSFHRKRDFSWWLHSMVASSLVCQKYVISFSIIMAKNVEYNLVLVLSTCVVWLRENRKIQRTNHYLEEWYTVLRTFIECIIGWWISFSIFVFVMLKNRVFFEGWVCIRIAVLWDESNDELPCEILTFRSLYDVLTSLSLSFMINDSC